LAILRCDTHFNSEFRQNR